METTNKKYRPEIFVPDPWIPSIEARTKTKDTIYKIQIPTKTVTAPTATSFLLQYQELPTEPLPTAKQLQTDQPEILDPPHNQED